MSIRVNRCTTDTHQKNDIIISSYYHYLLNTDRFNFYKWQCMFQTVGTRFVCVYVCVYKGKLYISFKIGYSIL